MHQPRHFFAATVFQGYCFDFSCLCLFFSLLFSIPRLIGNIHGLTALLGRLLTVGGMSYRRDRRSQRVGATMPVTTVEAYDPAANRWFRLAPLNYARSHGVCITASLE